MVRHYLRESNKTGLVLVAMSFAAWTFHGFPNGTLQELNTINYKQPC